MDTSVAGVWSREAAVLVSMHGDLSTHGRCQVLGFVVTRSSWALCSPV